jgi:hypothetical protein
MDDLKDKQHELLFDVRRSVRYHNERRKHYNFMNLLVSALSILFGSAVFVTILSSFDKVYTLVIAGIVTVLSTFNLLIGTSSKACLHFDLYRRFIELEKKIVAVGEKITEEDLIRFTSERLDIEGDEPSILRVLDTLCYNELARAMGYSKDHFKKVTWLQRKLAPFFDYRQDKIAV